MKHSIKVGFNFGVTSGIITTLGLMMGLYSGTNSALVVIGGIMMIAIADSFSDSLGIHISEEGEGKHTKRQVWQSTLSTFFFKFVFASIFIIPFLFLELKTGVYASIVLGMILLGFFSFNIAKKQKRKPLKIILEHLIIAALVIAVTYYLGIFIGRVFV